MDAGTMVMTWMVSGVFDNEPKTEPLASPDLVAILGLVALGAAAFGIFKLIDWLDP